MIATYNLASDKIPNFFRIAFTKKGDIIFTIRLEKGNMAYTLLAALLRGKSLEVYARLPPKKAQDYETSKGALLKRFNKTEECCK